MISRIEAISGYDLLVDRDFRTSFCDQGRAMACLSWEVKSIKGLEAYQLTVLDDMYYDHWLLMSQRTDVHPVLTGDVNVQQRLVDAVLRGFRNHGIKGCTHDE